MWGKMESGERRPSLDVDVSCFAGSLKTGVSMIMHDDEGNSCYSYFGSI